MGLEGTLTFCLWSVVLVLKAHFKGFFPRILFHRKFMLKIPKMVYNRVLILATFYNENTLDNCSLLTILKLATILGSQKNLSVLKFSQQC